MFNLKKLRLSGAEVLPIIEGGKGIAISTGLTAGTFASCDAIGTISGTNPPYYDENGNMVRYYFDPAWTRKEKFAKLLEYSIKGCIDQVKIATEVACGRGRIHLNFLWEAGGTKYIIDEVLSKVKNMVHGVTCGAGLPYGLSDIAAKHNVYYYPIVSSARAFNVLWKRSYSKASELLGAVVYEDPWLAGGHNGLSNNEDPNKAQDPYKRIVELRKTLMDVGLAQLPIVIAGGVWSIGDWSNYLENEEVGPVAFQFGTRPLLTKESPISDDWKKMLFTLKEGDVFLNKFSPTGFYSSAVNNAFIKELKDRNSTDMQISRQKDDIFTEEIPSGNGLTVFYVKKEDIERVKSNISKGWNTIMRTPDGTGIFTTPQRAQQIKADQAGCMGCLSACRFSGWATNEEGSTGIAPDPRSFCIEKTLQSVAYGGSIDDNLVFAGHQAFKFAKDPLYKNGNIPTIKELIETICIGK